MLKNMFNSLEQCRNEWKRKKGKDNGAFYLKCEECYEVLTTLMKKHGMFFREANDPGKAILNM